MNHLSQPYIDAHRAKFASGASRFISERQMDRYGIAQTDGTSFVVPTSAANHLMHISKDHPYLLERLLGLLRGQLSDSRIIKIDFPAAIIPELNLRLPNGKEAGANQYWLPTGHLYTKIPEAVIDSIKAIPWKDYHTSTIQ